MPPLHRRLSNLTDLDADVAEQLRDALLSELKLPTAWDVSETNVEPAHDGEEDWFLVTFQHRSDPEKRASVYLLEGSYELQLYIESAAIDEWSDPTKDPTEITATLRHHA